MQGLGRQLGQVQRLLAVLEQLQVPLAQVREQLGIPGMDAATAANFRDKARIKTVPRPTACRARGTSWPSQRPTPSNLPDGWVSARGKPPAGPGEEHLPPGRPGVPTAWLDASPRPGPAGHDGGFLAGDEGSYDSVMAGGRVISDSVSDYLKRRLILRHPWMQSVVLLPPTSAAPEYADIGRSHPLRSRPSGSPPGSRA